MKNATKTMAATFGVLAGVAGIEHGIGEILQGNIAPQSRMILSWPDSAFFEIVAGEPAMTIVPSLLVTGILAILVSLIFILWATRFIQTRYGGWALILISIVWLLVGGGFGPPIFGIIIGAASTRIQAAPIRRQDVLPARASKFPAQCWPWFFGAAIATWLLMLPGTNILSYFLGVNNENLIYAVLLGMFGFLFLTIFSGYAYDKQSATIP